MSFLRIYIFLSLLLSAGGATAWAQSEETIHAQVDENPVPIKTPPPNYPLALKQEGVSGVVEVVIVINETGNVVSTMISKSSNRMFDKPAHDAVVKWKFKPARKDGIAVKVRVKVPIRFNVE